MMILLLIGHLKVTPYQKPAHLNISKLLFSEDSQEVVVMQFDHLENILEDEGIVFLSYGGSMTQPLISGMTDALGKRGQE